MFLGNTVNPTILSFYIPFSGAETSPGGGFSTYALAMAPMPVACTLDVLRVVLTGTGGSGSNTQTITVYKNGAATALSCTVASPGIGGSSSCSSTTPVAVAAGDTVALFGSQTSSSPIYRIGTGVRCNN
jgi:hypothetical protein